MASETLLATLSQTLKELGLRRNDQEMVVTERGQALDSIRVRNLRTAQEEERKAVYRDDQLMKQIKELTDHYNSLPTTSRPQAILGKIEQLSSDQLTTSRKRRAAQETVRRIMQAEEEAKVSLAVSEQELQKLETQQTELLAEIGRLNQQQ